MHRRKTRSPRPHPRLPAQSLAELRDHLLNDTLLDYLFFPVIAILWAMHEWFRHWFGFVPQHLAASAIAILSLAVSASGIIKLRKQLLMAKSGIMDKMSVGQYLEQFRVQGYQVFHDVPGEPLKGERFNIDHVLIGPGGVFTVETKDKNKPDSGFCIIECDRQNVLINGVGPRRNPIKKALAQRHYLRNLLIELTGQAFPVQPIIVYPGWFVHNKSPGSAVQVLNEKMIQQALNASKFTLAEDQIHRASYHLSRHITNVSKVAA